MTKQQPHSLHPRECVCGSVPLPDWSHWTVAWLPSLHLDHKLKL